MTKKTQTTVKKTKNTTPPVQLARLDLPIQQAGLEKYAANPDDMIGRAADSPATVVRIPIAAIVESSENARRAFDQAELEGLAQSMRAVGLREPVELKPRGERDDGSPGAYELVDGARRYRAAKLLGWTDIPAFIHNEEDLVVATVRAVRNNQRVNLTPYEEALDFRNIMAKGATVEQVAALVGRSEDLVKQRLKLLELPADIAQRIGTDGLTLAHAEQIIPIAHNPELLEKARKVLDEKDYRGKPLTGDEFHRRLLTALESGKGARAVMADDYKFWGVKETKKWKETVAALPKVTIPASEGKDVVVIDAEGKLADLKREYDAKQREKHSAVEPKKMTEAERKTFEKQQAKEREDRLVRDTLNERLPEIFKKSAVRIRGFDKRTVGILLRQGLEHLPYDERSVQLVATMSGVPTNRLESLHSEQARGKLADELTRKKDLAAAARLLVGLVVAQQWEDGGVEPAIVEAVTGTPVKDLEKKIRKEVREKSERGARLDGDAARDDEDLDTEEE